MQFTKIWDSGQHGHISFYAEGGLTYIAVEDLRIRPVAFLSLLDIPLRDLSVLDADLTQ